MKTVVPFLFILLSCYQLQSQQPLPDLNGVKTVSIISYWGDQSVVGFRSGTSQKPGITVTYTNETKKPRVLMEDFDRYVRISRKGSILAIEALEPQGFESLDINVSVPETLVVTTKLLNGGNIYIENIKGGVEVNSFNGSVKLRKIGAYALVSAANGEVDVQFEKIARNQPISLITMNGGVTVELPAIARRDLRLISRKNGYVNSEFELQSDVPAAHLNTAVYSKKPIIASAMINGGGELLFLSTQNGPLTIKKWH